MAYYTLFQRDTERLAYLEDLIERRLYAEPAEIITTSAVAGKVGRCSIPSPYSNCMSSSSTQNRLQSF